MKKLVLALALFSAPLALPAAAQVGNLPPAPNANANAGANSAAASVTGGKIGPQAWLWRLKPQVGARYKMRTFSRTAMNLQGAALSPREAFRLVTIQKSEFDYDVLSRDRFGATTFRLTYRDFSTDVTSLNQTLTPAQKRANAASAARVRAALVGQSFEIKQAPDGQIWGISGFEAILKRLGTAVGVESQIRASSNSASIVRSLEQSKGAIPATPVRVSEAWNYSIPSLEIGLVSVSVEGQRQLRALEGPVAVVGENARLTLNLGALPGAQAQEFSGTIIGASRVDTESGLPLESNLTTVLSGTFVANKVQGGDGKFTFDSQSQTRAVLEPR